MLRRQGHRLVAAAGGGGGAGNADRCCAGGGAGGGERGGDGGSPTFDQAVVGTGGAGECQNGWCSASEVHALSLQVCDGCVRGCRLSVSPNKTKIHRRRKPFVVSAETMSNKSLFLRKLTYYLL